MFLILIFFLFQAEDGIRDGHVTGVQTCALPIYGEILMKELHNPEVEINYEELNNGEVIVKSPFLKKKKLVLNNIRVDDDQIRSEERRVGKECRYQCNKDC